MTEKKEFELDLEEVAEKINLSIQDVLDMTDNEIITKLQEHYPSLKISVDEYPLGTDDLEMTNWLGDSSTVQIFTIIN
jgi:hypothetical protein